MKLFKLWGKVEVDTAKAEGSLHRVDGTARRASVGLRQADQAARQTGAEMAAAASGAGRLASALSSVGRSGGGLGSLLNVAGGNILSGAVQAALSGVTGALKDGWQQGIAYNKMVEKASISFTTLLGSAEKAQKHLDELRKFGEATPFEFPDLIKASQRMQAMGFAGDQIIPTLTAVGDAVSAVGGGKEELDGVVLALGQMKAKGKVSAEEMQQLAERGIPAWDLLAQAIGKTKAETMKLSEQGRLDGGGAADALVTMMGERFRGQMTKMSGTLEGLESNFADLVNSQLATVTKGNFNQLKSAYAAGIAGFGTDSAGKFSAEVNTFLTESGKGVEPLLKKFATGEYFAEGARAAKAVQPAAVAGASMLSDAVTKGPQSLMPDVRDVGKEGWLDKQLDDVKRIGGLLKQGWNWLANEASKSFSDGVSTGAPAAQSAGAALGGAAEQGVRQALDQHSPSRVLTALGEQAAQSFHDGFDSVARLEGGKRSLLDTEALKRRTLEELKKLRQDPRVRAMLDTIGTSEGTGNAYNMKFGGGRFSDLSEHPNDPVTRLFWNKKTGRKESITSTAAGRYQFLYRTWQRLVKQLGLPDFSPESQDLGAIELMRQRGMIEPLMRGDIASALTAGNREWASLPGSPYGQPTKKASTLVARYNNALTGDAGVAAAIRETAANTRAIAQTTSGGKPLIPQEAEIQVFTKDNPSTKIQADLARMFGSTRQPKVTGAQVGGSVTIAGGEVVTQVAAKLHDALVPLSEVTPAMIGGLTGAGAAMENTASKAGTFGSIISAAGNKTAEAGDAAEHATEQVNRLAEAFGQAFDDMFDAVLDGSLSQNAVSIGKRLVKDLLSGMTAAATGGRFNSPGAAISGLLFGGPRGAAAATAGAAIGGSSASGGVVSQAVNALTSSTTSSSSSSGSSPTNTASTGGLLSKITGNRGGLFSKGGWLDKLFGGRGAAAAKPQMVGDLPVFAKGIPVPSIGGTASSGGWLAKLGVNGGQLGASGLLAGGGLLGAFAGGQSGIGRLLGTAGGSLLAGALGATGIFGSGIAGALPALFSNPFTAIAGGALIGGALLARWLSGAWRRSLRKQVKGYYDLDVKHDSIFEGIKKAGESKFGKNWRKHELETIKLPDVREMLFEYARSHGLKGNSRLFSAARIQDPYSSENVQKRAHGGYISGPGTGTSDSIPAMLSNGEGVITADATRHYGGKAFIDAINGRRLARAATGGVVGGSRGYTRRLIADLERLGNGRSMWAPAFRQAAERMRAQYEAPLLATPQTRDSSDVAALADTVADLAAGLAELNEVTRRWRAISPDAIISAASDAAVTDKVRANYRRRGAESAAIRTYNTKR